MLRRSALAASLVTSLVIATVASLVGAGASSASAAGEFDNNFHNPTGAGAVTYFAGYERTKGVELFKTDGTRSGTTFVKDVYPGSSSAFTSYSNIAENLDPQFTTIGTRTYFRAMGPSGLQLWVTDGTSAGTVQLTHEAVYNGIAGTNPLDLTVYDGELYFSGTSAVDGRELWKSNGTVAGTRVAANIVPAAQEPPSRGPNHRYPGSYPRSLVVSNGILFFLANGPVGTTRPTSVWQFDGASARLDARVDTADTGYILEGGITAFGNGVAYVLNTDQRGTAQQIWTTDGTVAGTGAYTPSGVVDGVGLSIVSFDGALYFLRPGVSGPHLWRTNGQGEAPVLVSGGNLRSENSVRLLAGKLWFLTYDTVIKSETLWDVTSSTAAANPVRELDVARRDYSFQAGANAAGDIYFIQNDSLWKSDGTSDGTVRVRDFGLWGRQLRFSELGASDSAVTIAVRDAHEVDQLWISDGTTAGTVRALPLDTFSAPVPTIVGKAAVGTELGGRIGTWTPSPAFTYQWRANGKSIPGATGRYFTVTPAQLGARLTYSVTGTLSGYVTTTKTSAASTVVK